MKNFSTFTKQHRTTLLSTLTITGMGLALTGCATASATAPEATVTASQVSCGASTGADTTAATVTTAHTVVNGDASDLEWSASEEKDITLAGESVTIEAPGTYRVSGEITDGQLLIDTSANGMVRIILDGVTIANSAGAAIQVANAAEVLLFLEEGSTNTLSDAASYETDAEVNAALFSTANLTIAGSGTLTVTGNGADGITSKDGLVILGGTLNVTATDDGIRGKDYLVIDGADVTVTAGGDGLSSTNTGTETSGYISLLSGNILVNAGADAVQATTDVLFAGASSTLTATDDGVNSGCVTLFDGGSTTIVAGDDGIHSDGEAFIQSGKVIVSESYEALEAAAIYISGGTIELAASDDGVNIATTDDVFSTALDFQMTITGGSLTVNSGGDGIDIAGAFTMTDGTVVVYGPTEQNNGPLDVDGDFMVSGGSLLAMGSSGMAVAPSTSSEQASIKISLSNSIKAGQTVTILNAAGETIATFTPPKNVESVVYSSAGIISGQAYTIDADGVIVGTGTAGDYTNDMMGGPGGGKRPAQ